MLGRFLRRVQIFLQIAAVRSKGIHIISTYRTPPALDSAVLQYRVFRAAASSVPRFKTPGALKRFALNNIREEGMLVVWTARRMR